MTISSSSSDFSCLEYDKCGCSCKDGLCGCNPECDKFVIDIPTEGGTVDDCTASYNNRQKGKDNQQLLGDHWDLACACATCTHPVTGEKVIECKTCGEWEHKVENIASSGAKSLAMAPMMSGDGNTEDVFINSEGTTKYYFSDEQTENPAGKISRIVAPNGKETVYSYDNQGRIFEIRRVVLDNEVETNLITRHLYYNTQNPEDQATTPHNNIAEMVSLIQVDADPEEATSRTLFVYDGPTQNRLKAVRRQIRSQGNWVDHETTLMSYYTKGGISAPVKHVLELRAFARLAADPEVSDPMNASQEKIAQYAERTLEYDAEGRAAGVRWAHTEAALSLRGTESSLPDGYNNWRHRSVQQSPNGIETIIYSNHEGQQILKEIRDGDSSVLEYREYDELTGNLTLHATSAAIVSYVDNAGPDQNELNVTLRADEGLIHLHEHYPEDNWPSHGAPKRPSAEKIQRGTAGTPITLARFEYVSHEYDGITIYKIAKETDTPAMTEPVPSQRLTTTLGTPIRHKFSSGPPRSRPCIPRKTGRAFRPRALNDSTSTET